MRHLAFGVDMTLLMTHLAVVTDAVGVLKLPVKSKRLPPTVKRVLSLTSLCGLMSHTILPYVVFLFAGIADRRMAVIVLVPFMSLMPWANCPSSLEKERIHVSLLSPYMRCLYSSAFPVAAFMTELDPRKVVDSVIWMVLAAKVYLDRRL